VYPVQYLNTNISRKRTIGTKVRRQFSIYLPLTITYSHGGNAGLGEEAFGLLELAIPLVGLGIGGLVGGQVALPAPDDVPAQLGVLQIGPLEGVDLSLQIGQLFLSVHTI